MLNTKRSLLLTATILALQSPIIANAGHGMYKSTSYDSHKHGHADVHHHGSCAHVVSSNGNPVHDSNGNLVYTKWSNSSSTCECHEEASMASKHMHTYHVYFDFNKARLNKHSKSIVAEAVSSIHGKDEEVHFTLGGHTDSSGKAAYNLKLSERRAQAVADELIRHGIKAEHIKIEAFGEANPLVPTADNVKEAKNRVVKIALHGM